MWASKVGLLLSWAREFGDRSHLAVLHSTLFLSPDLAATGASWGRWVEALGVP